MEKVFKIKDIDQGYCRVLYGIKNDDNQEVYYCIQEEYKNTCKFYRCTLGPYYEPMYPANVKSGSEVLIEAPKGDSELEKAVRNYIEANKGMVAV